MRWYSRRKGSTHSVFFGPVPLMYCVAVLAVRDRGILLVEPQAGQHSHRVAIFNHRYLDNVGAVHGKEKVWITKWTRGISVPAASLVSNTAVGRCCCSTGTQQPDARRQSELFFFHSCSDHPNSTLLGRGASDLGAKARPAASVIARRP